MAQEKTKRKMKKKQDKEDWVELCDYIRLNVMGYPNDMALSQTFENKLKKLSEICDKFEANKNDNNGTRNYYYHVVLNTYRFCSEDIQWALKNKTFKNDTNKFNYIYKIVENNLSTVYVRTVNAQTRTEKSATIDMSVHHYKGADFKPTQRRIVSSRLKELWNEVL